MPLLRVLGSAAGSAQIFSNNFCEIFTICLCVVPVFLEFYKKFTNYMKNLKKIFHYEKFCAIIVVCA